MAVSFASSSSISIDTKINKSKPSREFFSPSQAPAYTSVKANDHLLDHVFSIRYESYSSDGFIEKNPLKRFTDEYDLMPNCTSYLTYHQKRPMGSIRLCRYSPLANFKVPVMDIYKREIEQEIGFDKSFLEANRFVIHPDYQRKGGIQARFSVYRNIITEADKAHTHCVLAAVREEHVRFYRMVNFTPISDVRTYHGVKFGTILMACFDLERSREFVLNQTDKRALTRKNDYLLADSRC